MSRTLTTYSFNNVAAYLNGLLVEGLWEGDDVIMVEPNADLSVPVVGADGKAIISVTMNQAANITLKLQPTSDTHKQLLRIYDHMQSGFYIPFSFGAIDTGSGEGGSAAQCVITRRPNSQFGDQASVREWQIFAGCWVNSQVEY